MAEKKGERHLSKIESSTMETPISKTQIDRLGDRLRKESFTDSDLRLLDEYRRSFTTAYGKIVGTIRGQLGLEPTGRPAKSTTSIAEKLRRESIRLSQIQDIAGCRLIVSDMVEQDRVVASLVELFPGSTIVDRREQPSHGYRAVHVIAKVDIKGVEIQLRSTLQQLWAELSEKLSDLIDPTIKYGGGNESIKEFLATTSKLVQQQERGEIRLLRVQQTLLSLSSKADLTQETAKTIMDLQGECISLQETMLNNRTQTVEVLQRFIKNPPRS